jgi:hypothetical protein
MKEAATAAPMETSDLVPVPEISLDHLAKASGSMENNLRVLNLRCERMLRFS